MIIGGRTNDYRYQGNVFSFNTKTETLKELLQEENTVKQNSSDDPDYESSSEEPYIIQHEKRQTGKIESICIENNQCAVSSKNTIVALASEVSLTSDTDFFIDQNN